MRRIGQRIGFAGTDYSCPKAPPSAIPPRLTRRISTKTGGSTISASASTYRPTCRRSGASPARSSATDEIVRDWGFVNYRPRDSLVFNFGKIKYPNTLVSAYFEVGYAQAWVTPPAEFYSHQVLGPRLALESLSGGSRGLQDTPELDIEAGSLPSAIAQARSCPYFTYARMGPDSGARTNRTQATMPR